jgi:FkbM family methyltransferase
MIPAFFRKLRDFLYARPLLDELWYRANRYFTGIRLRIKVIHGSKMELDLRDSGVCRDLFLWGGREPECTRIFKGELREGDVVLDIGANIGYYVLLEALFLGPKGKIYALEPSPETYRRLVKNLELNAIEPEVELRQLAVSDRPGKVVMQLGPASNHHRILPQDSMAERRVEVEATTIDDLIGDKKIDMIRLDTEGSEVLIIQGMKNVLARGGPLKMFIEVHPKLAGQYGSDIGEMLNTLAEAGFRVNHFVEWIECSHALVPYLLGQAPRERSIAFCRPLADLLADAATRDKLVLKSGHAFDAGYKLFLER